MELRIDLLKGRREKSLFGIIFGILLFLLASGWIIMNEIITPFDWFYFLQFPLFGIIIFIKGLGYPIESLFGGKAYVLIDPEQISLKISVFSKNQSVNWNEIKSISYKVNKFEIKKTDNTNMIIKLSTFDYITATEVKKTINCIANEKNIQLNY